jgi:hypothetical protein
MLFESSENVPMGKRELVCVVLDDPYRPLPNDDDLSCSKGKSCPNREFDVERFVKLNACDALPEKLCDHNLVLTTKKNITVAGHRFEIDDGRILIHGVGRLEGFPLRIGGHSLSVQ